MGFICMNQNLVSTIIMCLVLLLTLGVMSTAATSPAAFYAGSEITQPAATPSTDTTPTPRRTTYLYTPTPFPTTPFEESNVTEYNETNTEETTTKETTSEKSTTEESTTIESTTEESTTTESTTEETTTEDLTTQESTTEESTTENTTMKTTPEARKEINIENAVIKVNLSAKFNKDFQEELLDHESEVYKHAAKKYKDMLKSCYEDMQNFKTLRITNFWPGSTGVNYTVYIMALADQTPSKGNDNIPVDVTSVPEEHRPVDQYNHASELNFTSLPEAHQTFGYIPSHPSHVDRFPDEHQTGVNILSNVASVPETYQPDGNSQSDFTTSVLEQLQESHERVKQLPDVDQDYVDSSYYSSLEEVTKTLETVQADPCQMRDLCKANYKCETGNGGQDVGCVYKCNNYHCPSHQECFVDETLSANCKNIETTTEETTTEKSTTEEATTEEFTSKETTTEETIMETTPGLRKQINIENAVVKADFSAKFEKDFQKELLYPESEVYKNTAKEYKDKLKPLFEHVKNFKDVDINEFWPGSLGVDYTVIIMALTNQTLSNDNDSTPLDVTSITEELRQVKDKLMQLPDVDQSYISFTFDYSVEEAAKTLKMAQIDPCQMPDLCEPDYRCETENDGQEMSCVYKCSSFTCPRHGECFIDEYHMAKCRCIQTDKYVYSGEDCSVETEKLALSFTEIIAISLFTSLAVIVIVIVINVLITRKRIEGLRKAKNSGDSDISIYGSEIGTTRKPDMADMRPVEKGRHGDMFYTGGMEQNVSSSPRRPSSRTSQLDMGYYEILSSGQSSRHPNYPPSMVSSRSVPEQRLSVNVDNTNMAPRDSLHGVNWGHGPALALNPRASWSLRSAQQSVADDNEMYLPRSNDVDVYRPTSRMMSRTSRDEVERRTCEMYDRSGIYAGRHYYSVVSDDMMPHQSPVQPRPHVYQERQRLYQPARAPGAAPSTPRMSRDDLRGYMPSVDEGRAWMDNASEQGQKQLPRLFWRESAF